jgi:hypothetical protein
MDPIEMSDLTYKDYAFRAAMLREFGVDPGMCNNLRKALRDKYGEE